MAGFEEDEEHSSFICGDDVCDYLSGQQQLWTGRMSRDDVTVKDLAFMLWLCSAAENEGAKLDDLEAEAMSVDESERNTHSCRLPQLFALCLAWGESPTLVRFHVAGAPFLSAESWAGCESLKAQLTNQPPSRVSAGLRSAAGMSLQRLQAMHQLEIQVGCAARATGLPVTVLPGLACAVGGCLSMGWLLCADGTCPPCGQAPHHLPPAKSWRHRGAQWGMHPGKDMVCCFATHLAPSLFVVAAADVWLKSLPFTVTLKRPWPLDSEQPHVLCRATPPCCWPSLLRCCCRACK
jgi:hypothetical protein